MSAVSDDEVRHLTGQSLPALVTLTLWRFRHNGVLLVLLESGMLCAMILVCTATLFSQVALTAGIRDLLQQYPNDYLTVAGSSSYRSISEYPSLPRIQDDQQQITSTLRHHFGVYLQPAPQRIADTTYDLPLGISQPHHPTGGKMTFQGFDMQDIASHVKLLQGHLPQYAAHELEIAVSPQIAHFLQMNIGDTFLLPLDDLMNSKNGASSSISPSLSHLVVRLVGIFTVNNGGDAVWHDHFFESDRDKGYRVLVAMPAMINTFGWLEQQASDQQLSLQGDFACVWYYHLDSRQMDVNHVQTLLTDFADTTNDLLSHSELTRYVYDLKTDDLRKVVSNYQNRVEAGQVPEIMVVLLISSLLLIFMGLMSELLAEQQELPTALMRSRGASRPQIFVLVGLQSLLLVLLALALSPWFAILLTHMLTRLLLVPNDWGALNVLDDHLLAQISSVLGQGILIGLVAVASMTSLLFSNTSGSVNILSLRRESGRTQVQPLWMRLLLDVVVFLVGLVCYGCFLYVLNSDAFDPQTRVLLVSPLLLMTVFLFLLAGILFFLRLFPKVLSWLARLAAHGRSVDAMLAFAQMARAPRQSIRQVLLLSLTIAFALFTQIFLASQWERLPAVASYQAGSDFSGVRMNVASVLQPTIQEQVQPYHDLPGVLSASLGYREVAGSAGSVLTIQAVDTQNFASSVDWTPQKDDKPLPSLIQQLIDARSLANSQKVVPAIVDETTWQTLHLSIGTRFSVDESNGTLSYLAIAKVSSLPGMSAGEATNNGVLVDYQTYTTLFNELIQRVPPQPSFVWLHTRDDANSLQGIRIALNSGPLQLNPLYDRRQLLTQLQHDPLLLALVGLLLLGAIVPLIFAVGGSLVAFVISARSRITNIAVLRALGCSSQQISRMLLWEQGLIYSIALLLGGFFGGVLTLFAIPALIFSNLPPTGITSTENTTLLYTLQTVPPVHITLPPSLTFSTVGLVVLVVGTFTLVALTVLRPVLGEMLRLNED